MEKIFFQKQGYNRSHFFEYWKRLNRNDDISWRRFQRKKFDWVDESVLLISLFNFPFFLFYVYLFAFPFLSLSRVFV